MDTLQINPSEGVSNQTSETSRNNTQLCSCGSGKPQNECCGISEVVSNHTSETSRNNNDKSTRKMTRQQRRKMKRDRIKSIGSKVNPPKKSNTTNNIIQKSNQVDVYTTLVTPLKFVLDHGTSIHRGNTSTTDITGSVYETVYNLVIEVGSINTPSIIRIHHNSESLLFDSELQDLLLKREILSLVELGQSNQSVGEYFNLDTRIHIVMTMSQEVSKRVLTDVKEYVVNQTKDDVNTLIEMYELFKKVG